MSFPIASAPEIAITSFSEYLNSRKELISARDAFFVALRTYMRPEQRPDSDILQDPLHQHPARQIDEQHWVINASRGYAVILADPSAFRPFQLSIVQQGFELQISLRVSTDWFNQHSLKLADLKYIFRNVSARITNPMSSYTDLTWREDATNLFSAATCLEDAVFRIDTLFNEALFLFLVYPEPV